MRVLKETLYIKPPRNAWKREEKRSTITLSHRRSRREGCIDARYKPRLRILKWPTAIHIIRIIKQSFDELLYAIMRGYIKFITRLFKSCFGEGIGRGSGGRVLN